MITVLGATGYTGQLIINELARLDLPTGGICLAGRSQERLSALAEKLPHPTQTAIVDLQDPNSLHQLPKSTRLLINCAGPFTLFGEQVVQFAALNGIHYLDTTNELMYVYRMHSYDQLARKNRCAIVPACAFEVALADCAAAVLAQRAAHPLEKIEVTYALSNSRSSPGTRQSAIHALGTGWLAYEERDWVGKAPCTKGKWGHFSGGKHRVISFPSSETATLPRHLQVNQIETWMAVSRRLYPLARIFFPLAAGLARTPLRSFMLQASRLGSREIDPHAPFSLQVTTHTAQGTHSMTLSGEGPYEITARIVVYAARRILESTSLPAGVLAPAQCLNPQDFLAYAEENWGVQVHASSLPDER